MSVFISIGWALMVMGNQCFGTDSSSAEAVRQIFTALRPLKNGEQKSCASCHNPNSDDGSGAFDDLLSVEGLKRSGIIVSGAPENTRLFKAVSREGKRFMPLGGERLSDREMGLLKRWLTEGAPQWQTEEPAAPVTFLSDQKQLETILDDIGKIRERDRHFQRYFTLTHLYNAGRAKELPTYRRALAKLVNSLSWQRQIRNPVSVDPLGTILRIDLRELRWSAETWERILDVNPYRVEVDNGLANRLESETGIRSPFVRADWFIHAASRPPLYYEVLDLPNSDQELEKQLGVDLDRDVEQETVIRAGFRDSGVSLNNRVIERHESNYGAYWKSYDFASSEKEQNIFAHPLDFQKNGGEIIFNLPNGLQAYILINAVGKRLDEAPIAIVQDKRRGRDGFTVVDGVSCMRCHSAGIIRHEDQIRKIAGENRTAFSKADLDRILGLYPEPETLDSVYSKDENRFLRAMAKMEAPVAAEDSVFPLAERFDEDLDVGTAAAELGMTSERLIAAISDSPGLRLELGFDGTGQGRITRNAFLGIFGKLAEELHLGVVYTRTPFTPSPSASEPAPQTRPPSMEKGEKGKAAYEMLRQLYFGTRRMDVSRLSPSKERFEFICADAWHTYKGQPTPEDGSYFYSPVILTAEVKHEFPDLWSVELTGNGQLFLQAREAKMPTEPVRLTFAFKDGDLFFDGIPSDRPQKFPGGAYLRQIWMEDNRTHWIIYSRERTTLDEYRFTELYCLSK